MAASFLGEPAEATPALLQRFHRLEKVERALGLIALVHKVEVRAESRRRLCHHEKRAGSD
jgi:hypothetical protein